MDEDTTKDDADLTPPEDGAPDSWNTVCPGCGESIPGKWTICPKCDYDFLKGAAPTDSGDRRKRGIPYSALADLALLVGQAFAIIGFVSAVIAAIVLIYNLNVFGFFLAVMSFFNCFALYVVFARAYDMKAVE